MRLLSWFVLCCLVTLLAAGACGAANVYWVPDFGGYWHNATYWSSYPYLPGSSDDVRVSKSGVFTVEHSTGTHTINSFDSNQKLLLSGGQINLMNASQCTAGFDQSNGQLGGYGSLALFNTSQWTGGTISSLGGVTNNGVWYFSGTGTRYLQGYISNFGTLIHTGTLDISSGGRLYNAANKQYEIRSDTGITSTSLSGTFDNYGSFKKTTTAGTSDIGCVFNNRGTVYPYSGKLQFSGGGTWREGDINTNLATGSVVFNSGAYTIADQCWWRGSGSVSIAGGTFSLMTGSEIACDLGGGLNISYGTISGLGRIINDGVAGWTGGTFSGIGGFENNDTMTIGGTRFKYLENSPFSNKGIITHTGSYGLIFSQSSRFANLPGATYELQSDADFVSWDGTGQIDNGGTIRKSYSYGTTYVDPYLNTSGPIEVNSGIMELWGGGQFVNGGAHVGHSATLALMSGTFTVYGEYQSDYGGTYALSGGTLLLTEGATARFGLEQGLSLAGSTVTGHGNLINTLNMNWSGGTITGATHFGNEAPGTLTISDGSSKTLENAEFYNAGSVIQTSAAGLTLGVGGVLINRDSGTFEFRGDGGILGTGTINNGGVFSKAWSSGVSTIEPVFNNTLGSLDVDNGTIRLAGGGSFDQGGASITHPGSLSIYGGSYAVSGTPLFTGTGSATISGGTLNLSTGAQMIFSLDQGLTLAGGTVNGPGGIKNTKNMTWSGGTLAGAAQLGNEGTLTISGGSQKLLDGSQLHNLKDIVQTGTVGLKMAGGALLASVSGSTYELRTDAGISGTGTINSSGFLNKTYGTGTSVIEPSLNFTYGGMNVLSGSMKLMGGGSFYHSGANVVRPDGLVIAAGNYQISDQNDFIGEGSVVLQGGSLNFNPGGRANFGLTGGLRLAGGTLAGNGAALIHSTGEWTGGIIADDAVLQVERDKEFAVSGSSAKSLKKGRLVARGTVHHLPRTAVEVREGSSVEVAAGGVYDLQVNGGLTGDGLIRNFGIFRKSGSLDTSIVDPTLDNIGQVEVVGGTLVFTGPVAQVVDGALTGGTWTVNDGCALVLDEKPLHTNAASVTLISESRFREFDTVITNSGTMRLLAGHGFEAVDAFTNSGTLELAGGEFVSGKNLNTGTWDAWGIIAGGFSNRGLLRPTPTKEALRISDGYSQTTAGTLETRIGGRGENQFGRLIVGGSATLNGTLKVSFVNGFVPVRGDTFRILTCKSRTGKFASIDGYDLGNGLYVNAVYSPDGVILTVGDYLPPATEVGSVAAARQQEPGLWLSLPGIVSAVFEDGFFVQDANRAAGLRVLTVQTPPLVGAKVQVVGRMTPYAPCLTLEGAQWVSYPNDPEPPRPLAMTSKSLGGAPLGQQGGVDGGTGLNNVGLLVTVAGRITYVEQGRFAYLDDGSGVIDGNDLGRYGGPVPGVRVILQPGVEMPEAKWATVTGISYRLYINDHPQRTVLIRSQEDIVPY